MLSYDSAVLEMNDYIASAGLSLVNNLIPTRFSNNSLPSLLDHILVSDMSVMLRFDQTSFVSDHDLLYCCIDIPLVRAVATASTYSYRDYKSINNVALIQDLSSVAWSDCWLIETVDDKLLWFSSIVGSLFDQYVPLKTVAVTNVSCPWFNHVVVSAIKLRNKLQSKWKRSSTESNWLKYIGARNKANLIIRNSKKQYFSKMLGNVSSTKKMWSNISKLRIFKKESVPCTLPPETLNKHFSTTVTASLPTNSNTTRQFCVIEKPFQFHSIEESDVAFYMSKITSNAVGFDGLPIRFLKLILPYIIPTLTHIINHCFTTSVFPSTWKVATITPIAKVNRPKQLNDFRPISILPALAKVCERAIAAQISEYVNNHQLLSPMQSGFRVGHSCNTALLKILDDIRVPYDKKHLNLLCLLDFTKAFDTVNHSILCSKLEYYFNFSKTASSLISNYLSNRFQRVKVGLSYSSFAEVVMGVPQGSTLGPLLFTLFINDIFLVSTHTHLHAFADDVQLYISGPVVQTSEIVLKLNEDLDSIHTWALENNLTLNSTKSKVIPIYGMRNLRADIPPVVLGNGVLELVDTVRNLGFIINRHLSCKDHVNHVISKIYFVLRVLRCTAEFTPVSVRCNVVMQLIIPHFLYFSLVYSKLDSVSLNKLNIVFNNVTRYVFSLRRFDHVSNFNTRILGVSLEHYLIIRNMIFLHQLISTRSPDYLYEKLCFGQSNRTRQLAIPQFSSLITSRLFFVNAVRLWNNLPLALRQIANGSAFKAAIHQHFSTSLS